MSISDNYPSLDEFLGDLELRENSVVSQQRNRKSKKCGLSSPAEQPPRRAVRLLPGRSEFSRNELADRVTDVASLPLQSPPSHSVRCIDSRNPELDELDYWIASTRLVSPTRQPATGNERSELPLRCMLTEIIEYDSRGSARQVAVGIRSSSGVGWIEI